MHPIFVTFSISKLLGQNERDRKGEITCIKFVKCLTNFYQENSLEILQNFATKILRGTCTIHKRIRCSETIWNFKDCTMQKNGTQYRSYTHRSLAVYVPVSCTGLSIMQSGCLCLIVLHKSYLSLDADDTTRKIRHLCTAPDLVPVAGISCMTSRSFYSRSCYSWSHALFLYRDTRKNTVQTLAHHSLKALLK